jgi:phosphoglucomutase
LLTVRYDYEEVESAGAEEMMEHLRKQFADSKFAGSSLKSTTSDSSFTVDHADDFSYTDPIDGSVSTKQGLFIKFTDGSRIIFRLSGTGSSGATVRLYVERYSKNESEYGMDAQDGLKPLIEVALEVSKLKEFTGREKPTVITVSPTGKVSCKVLMYSNQWSEIEYLRKRVLLDRECMNCE